MAPELELRALIDGSRDAVRRVIADLRERADAAEQLSARISSPALRGRLGMIPEDLRCATCIFWSRTLPPITTGHRRPTGADADLGTCQYNPPVVLVVGGAAVSMQPSTHSTRGCFDWLGQGDGPGGPDGGQEAEVIDLAARRDAA